MAVGSFYNSSWDKEVFYEGQSSAQQIMEMKEIHFIISETVCDF